MIGRGNTGQSEMRFDRPFDEEPPEDGFDLGVRRSRDSADRWTADEKKQVDAAIRLAAREVEEFTTDDVWKRCPDVPILKGMTARLEVARRAGLIQTTGEIRFCQRGGPHDHGQRLSVWRRVR